MTVRLYVGNLPEDVDRQALEDLFTNAGEVVSTKVIRDRKTGKCRGFAFLTVADEEIAQTYIDKFNGTAFGDITLKLEVAQPREREESGVPEVTPKSDSPKPTPKKRSNREGSSPRAASNGPETSGEPDPRWAAQLQRIKEQLQAQS